LDTPERHLSPEEFDWLSESLGVGKPAGGPEDVDYARRHLASCDRCQRLAQMHERIRENVSVLKASRKTEPGEGCPSSEEWGYLLAGLFSETRARELLEHCVDCDACSERLRDLSKDLSDDLTEEDRQVIEGLASSKDAWQRAMARRMIAASDTLHGEGKKVPRVPSRRFLAWTRWAYASAAALVLVAVAWFYGTHRDGSLDGLLAHAYAEQRTMELRVPGASYAPLRQERGSARSSVTKPSSLLRAEYLIKEGLASKPEDAALLGSKGEAELLEWQYDEAIASLRHALDLQPDSSDLLGNLATAYAQRGDVESRPLDYGQAIEYLGQALSKKPNDPVLLFNRAVVEERLNLFGEAAKDWENYLRVDAKGPWAKEALQRLDAIRRREKESSLRPAAERDPILAVQALEKHRVHNSASARDWPDSLDEDYLDIAVTQWLPALADATTRGSADMAERPEWRALSELSRILVSNHRDRWLADLLAAPATSIVVRGWKGLGTAAALNAAGDFDGASREAERAVRLLSTGKCPAGVARALWEQAYALQRQQHGDLCLRVDERGMRMNRSTAYPWIATQLDLEHSICSAMLGRIGSTRASTAEAVALSQSASYGTLVLRALQIAGTEVASEDPERSWIWFAKGLQRHWAGTYRPFRAYQFYAEMSFTPESRGQWHLARTLMSEATIHIARTPNRLTEAVARHSLAVDTQMTGETPAAIEQFQRAAQLFASVPQSPATRTFRFSAEVYEASLEVKEGQTDRALQSLSRARREYSEQSQYWVWLHYYQALGDALLQGGGKLDEAERALRSAVYISEGALSTLKTDADRSLWEQRTAGAYRSLVQVELRRKWGAEKVLELWEWYVAAPTRLPRRSFGAQAIDFAKVESAPELPAMPKINDSTIDSGAATVLSFADLNSGLLVWVFNRNGVQLIPLQVSRGDLERVERRFLRLCADPSSSTADVRRAGRQLYDWLFTPIEDRVALSRSLVLELDGVLRGIPFGALVDRQGEFLAQRYELVISPGLEFQNLLRRTPSFTKGDKALVVGTSASGTNAGFKLEPLPDTGTEARNVSFLFLHPTVLLGNEATFGALRRELPLVRVFHFAGHAVASPTRSGLVLAQTQSKDEPNGSSSEFLDAAKIRALAIPGTDLVVLSACATAGSDGDLADPESLVRAFLSAGVPHVIASRWNVDSHSTAELMGGFYDHLTHGERPAEALRSAAGALRQNPQTAHPYYWAAFAAFGRT
jgi:CHAT domain-containing protein/tetratricopeptide (TPR) repeat protein